MARNSPTSPQQIGQRLALTRRALGRTTTEMCRLIGSSTGGSAWTNYEMGIRRIGLDHALALCDTCGLTLEWIYLGEIKNLRPDLQTAIQQMLARQPRIANNC